MNSGKYINALILTVLVLMLTGCVYNGRYHQKHDSAPIRPPTQTELKDAIVTNEPVGRGNMPYVIKGIKYTPQKERQAHSEVGIASWYGKKFHGHLTSNGEIYDMYAMSAAHKTLPLPSYVKVTNLANNKSVVVRVNDRGPFHQNRIIDLSYSAAYKIGVYDTGTAEVKVEVLLAPPEYQYVVKVNGFNSQQEAHESAKGLSLMLNNEAKVELVNNLHQLKFGPMSSLADATSLLNKIKSFGFEQAELEQTN